MGTVIMSRSVTVHLSEFACSVVGGEGNEDREHLAEKVVDAIRCYLGDRGTYGPGWAYPRFLREEEYPEEVALQLKIDSELWDLLEEEAERQGVSPQKMVTHASLYVAGEVDAGRATRRILDGLEGPAEEEGGISWRAAPPREPRRAR
ncbi:MAG TPA: hypothetical protein VGN84_10150 [Solirubrobacterales bacterium]|nr:hypothetical protein [Solirubrobacterales bacterium]